jgi:hypothetical protein
VLIGWELLQRKAHIFIRFMADHYRPDSRPNHVYVINYKTSTGSWGPLFDKKGNPLYPQLMAELDAMKQLRPTGGLMLRRDGSGLPWSGKGEMLTQVERISKKIIIAAGLRPELKHHPAPVRSSPQSSTKAASQRRRRTALSREPRPAFHSAVLALSPKSPPRPSTSPPMPPTPQAPNCSSTAA